jgi:hypothetical protein
VVAFQQCIHRNDGILEAGRLWYDPRKSGKTKTKRFVSWADHLLSWMRRNFKERDEFGRLIGPDAAEQSRQGNLQSVESAHMSRPKSN